MAFDRHKKKVKKKQKYYWLRRTPSSYGDTTPPETGDTIPSYLIDPVAIPCYVTPYDPYLAQTPSRGEPLYIAAGDIVYSNKSHAFWPNIGGQYTPIPGSNWPNGPQPPDRDFQGRLLGPSGYNVDYYCLDLDPQPYEWLLPHPIDHKGPWENLGAGGQLLCESGPVWLIDGPGGDTFCLCCVDNPFGDYDECYNATFLGLLQVHVF